ncbi:D-sedoheptulose-7-phosphate isomerase [Desulforamulus aquiferis]|uniref:Phosphoheptose isomerase n=1 Tax=Desulforamulus aquiferis TaxID=1397668 RepID=A0AAW7ZGS5_9FIRM|nr:D-sedoheptulose 7-phosphate isomerase [Desulforamulus aquiferis]MDO7788440.1 D-sedoheptulose 7-phosphate isomerase [Desulforamulus aquiferis]RYD05687.1 hypothetical protein N752_07260 [Desulforamulus aquiferis]
MERFIRQQVEKSFSLKHQIIEDDGIIHITKTVAKRIIDAYRIGNKVIIAGNGGSAADAQHIAGELVSRFYFDRPGLPAIALTTDTSILTAIGNDYGYDNLFARQIQANGVKGDIFIGISTSGNSKNILKALDECRKKEITSIVLTGLTGGKMFGNCDYIIRVPSSETPRIQEVHILLGHIICSVVEEALFGKGF